MMSGHTGICVIPASPNVITHRVLVVRSLSETEQDVLWRGKLCYFIPRLFVSDVCKCSGHSRSERDTRARCRFKAKYLQLAKKNIKAIRAGLDIKTIILD